MSLQEKLEKRSDSKCELCENNSSLSIYEVPPTNKQTEDDCVLLCSTCIENIGTPTSHWRCLSNSMWSEYPAVQVMAWRILNELKNEVWAQDLFMQMYLSDESLKWAQAMLPDGDTPATVDSNGTTLTEGDSVTLIKDLDVKGAGFTAKRGTLVKGIKLTDNPKHIEGRVNGTMIVLVTAYLKKVN